MHAESLIFDVDGTLWNSVDLVVKGWNLALEEAGLAPHAVLTTAYPQMFRSLYFQGTAAFFATGMILNDHLRNRPANAKLSTTATAKPMATRM